MEWLLLSLHEGDTSDEELAALISEASLSKRLWHVVR